MASKKATGPMRNHVVLHISRRGLSSWVHAHGPFTKAEAGVFVSHRSETGEDEFTVMQMFPVPRHERYIFSGLEVSNA